MSSKDVPDTPAERGAKGGKARAEALDPAERSKIASQAAKARWSSEISDAICGSPDQPLSIGDIEIECYVLENGTRVLTQASMQRALGKHNRPFTRRDEGGEHVAPILQGKALQPFLSQEIRAASMPISFRLPNGTRASGYNAEILPAVCEVYLAAREAGALPYQQQEAARQAEILVRGLARVGIIALVDEATGYERVRAKDSLAKILEAFIEKELQPWTRTFPADFYEQMFRLRGLDFPSHTVKRPQYFGHLTNDVVYKRLAPGVLDELKSVAPKSESGKRKAKLFQNLTSHVGYPKLREHLGSVVTLMKLSDNWDDFIRKLDVIHPRVGDSMQIPFTDRGSRGL